LQRFLILGVLVAYPRDLAGRRRVFDLVGSGLTIKAAAGVAGVSYSAAWTWCTQVGGVMPRPAVYHGRFLSRDERYEIGRLRDAGLGVREIARAVRRDPGTISRELARNTNRRTGRYEPERAHRLAHERQRRPKSRKLASSARLRDWVQARLNVQDSPEQIAGRLKVEFPDDPQMRLSAETIYQGIYLRSVGQLRREMRSHLRTGRVTRRPRAARTARTANRGRIVDAVSISERPEEVEGRLVPGHHEGDLILGTMASNSAIGTIVERTTGFVTLVHLPHGHNAEQVAAAVAQQVTQLPEQLRKTLTWDRGKEMARHQQLAAATGMKIYFADPYSPYQRGTNENTNGLLRQYFPKGTDLSVHPADELHRVADILNNRPRKRLGFRTPNEVMTSLIEEDGTAEITVCEVRPD
jgi:IS30 family transposase